MAMIAVMQEAFLPPSSILLTVLLMKKTPWYLQVTIVMVEMLPRVFFVGVVMMKLVSWEVTGESEGESERLKLVMK